MPDPIEELERLYFLRRQAVLTAETAAETVAQIDAQITVLLRQVKDDKKAVTATARTKGRGGPGKPRLKNASAAHKAGYWAIFNAGGGAKGSRRVPFAEAKIYLDKTHKGAPLPDDADLMQRLQKKVPLHLIGDAAKGWQLTELGEDVMRTVKDPSRQLA